MNFKNLFRRLRDLDRCFGIRRSTAYALLNAGRIKSRVVQTKNSTTGVRLIDVKSVRDFLAKAPAKPSKRISSEMFWRGSQPKKRKDFASVEANSAIASGSYGNETQGRITKNRK
jgi:hypothetical protein